jgi:hypothetical protein
MEELAGRRAMIVARESVLVQPACGADGNERAARDLPAGAPGGKP